MNKMLLRKAGEICRVVLWSVVLVINVWADAGTVVSDKINPDTGQPLLLSRDRQTSFSIVLPQEASPADRSAADELQYFLAEITGAKLPIVTDAGDLPGQAILLGNNLHLKELGIEPDWSSLGEEGFILRTVMPYLVIAGGPRSGTLHGVYTFLEEILGCRWFAPGVSKIPKVSTLRLPLINMQKKPAFEYRMIIWNSAHDAAWAARHHLNAAVDVGFHSVSGDPRMSNIWCYAGPMVHTLPDLVPADKYFADHPEYFAEIDGRRQRGMAQICLTNPDVLRISVDTAKRWLAARPRARLVSISMGDFNNFCQCRDCSAAVKKMGSDSAVYMDFVNRVAEQIEREYPNVLVDTLAYMSVRFAPSNIRMRSNVVVRWADSEDCRKHALMCPLSIRGDTVGMLREWLKISPRVWYWYYTFTGTFLYPFDNIPSMSRNFKLLRDMGIKGVFVEGHGRFANDELAQLKAYIIAELCWDPDYDVGKGIQEFLEGYYGAAAPQMAAFLQLLHQEDTYKGYGKSAMPKDANLEQLLGRRLSFTGEHCNPNILAFIQPAALKKADKLFTEAERAVQDQPEIVDRVRVVRLSVWHLMLLHLPKDDPDRKRIEEEFFPSAERLNVGWVGNPGQTMADFKVWVRGH